jgi:hypothetical protein
LNEHFNVLKPRSLDGLSEQLGQQWRGPKGPKYRFAPDAGHADAYAPDVATGFYPGIDAKRINRKLKNSFG